MKLICWNVRELGNPRAINHLRNSLSGCHPQVVFLMKTKLDARRMERIRCKCGYLFGIDVSAVGMCEGLSIGWNHDFRCHVEKLFSFSYRCSY
ncbi:hypothetical protein GQ457_02G029520 [Hibiscus cannabinus]